MILKVAFCHYRYPRWLRSE